MTPREKNDVNQSPWMEEDTRIQGLPASWPSGVVYLTRPIVSPYLAQIQRDWLLKKPQPCNIPIIKLPQGRTEIGANVSSKLIEDLQHPANGQFGLFAARDLAPEELIIPYLGYVHSSTLSEQSQRDAKAIELSAMLLNSPIDNGSMMQAQSCSPMSGLDDPNTSIGFWDSSDYDLNLYRDEEMEIAIDASRVGNEARFCNDYRGVPVQKAILNDQQQWSRKSKRSAKSWEGSRPKSSEASSAPTGIVMPNAEFRDIWFDLVADGKEHITGAVDTFHVSSSSTTSANARTEDINLLDSDRTASATVPAITPPFTRRKKRAGMRGVAIFVLPSGKRGKRKNGIRAGQEILVSYGKGFWAHRYEAPDDAEEPP